MYALFVKVDAVVVLATGVTAATGMLAVLADTAVAGRDVALLTPRKRPVKIRRPGPDGAGKGDVRATCGASSGEQPSAQKKKNKGGDISTAAEGAPEEDGQTRRRHDRALATAARRRPRPPQATRGHTHLE